MNFPEWFQEFERDVEKLLVPEALERYGPFERLALFKSMERCKLSKYPAPTSDLDRCSGLCLCSVCGQTYFDHPMDWRVIGYGYVPFLHVLCNGRRVKL